MSCGEMNQQARINQEVEAFNQKEINQQRLRTSKVGFCDYMQHQNQLA